MPNKVKEESDYEENGQLDEAYDELDPAGLSVGSGRRGSTKENGGGYVLKNVLKLPRATTYSTQAVYDQIHAGDIDLSPEYQRDVVWPDSKQIGLIDSILRNFYIPPVIFDSWTERSLVSARFMSDSMLYSCLTAKPDKDPVEIRQTGDKYYYKSGATSQSARSMLLPEKYKRLFSNKQIVCIEYQDLPDTDEREIFQRVQLGMALTPAEKLQVANTPMASFIRSLQTQYLESSGPLGGDELDWDRSRGGDFRCITQALYLIAKYPLQTSVASVAQLEKWLQRPTSRPTRKGRAKGKEKGAADDVDGGDDDDDLSKDSSFQQNIHSTFRIFSQLVGDSKLRPLFLKDEWRVAPIEFVMMCLLISVDKDKLTLQEMAERLGEMRLVTRAEHLDVRANVRVAKTMVDFISRESEPNGSLKSSKRKRLGSSDDEYEPARKNKDQKVAGNPPSYAVTILRAPRPPISSQQAPTSTAMPTSTPTQTAASSPSAVVPPPRPLQVDRLQALRDAKQSVATSSSMTPTPPTFPAALR
ncbi:hypothetical protein ID866_2886 [Astraeus odoratus]|nr:hypothetical protein ID866_2886 [Astraeus odoratus]